jgi:hypothetical protein|tara:strand:+ start:425 stop:670 length:246 start_codon:yes stop_codon:yes gene_type:complete
MPEKQHSIFTYSLTNAPNSQKVRFVYALKGRGNNPGLIKKLKGNFLTQSCFIVESMHDKEVESFFNYWHIHFKKLKVIVVH